MQNVRQMWKGKVPSYAILPGGNHHLAFVYLPVRTRMRTATSAVSFFHKFFKLPVRYFISTASLPCEPYMGDLKTVANQK